MLARPDRLDHARLDVVTVLFNSLRFRSRWKLFDNFAKHVQDSGARLTTVEIAFGDRDFVVYDEKNPSPSMIGLRSATELWHKEAALNVAISRLPLDARYVAWIDADVQFARPDWVGETLHALQRYDVVQMWSEAIDLSPDYEPLIRHESFLWSHLNKRSDKPGTYDEQLFSSRKRKGQVHPWHPGFAWAARIEALNTLGGLFDVSILGGGDRNMADALLGRPVDMTRGKFTTPYVEAFTAWARRAARLNGNVGCVPGLLLHHWHGTKKSRAYFDRSKLLVDAKFDPARDLRRDRQGLWQIDEDAATLRDDIRRYLTFRNEDSIDLNETEITM